MKGRKKWLPVVLLFCLPVVALTQDDASNDTLTTVEIEEVTDPLDSETTQNAQDSNGLETTASSVVTDEVEEKENGTNSNAENENHGGVAQEEATTISSGEEVMLEEDKNVENNTVENEAVTEVVTQIANEISNITIINDTDTKGNKTDVENVTTVVVVTTVEPTTTSAVVIINATEGGLRCGTHAEAVNNTCICQNGWVQDPLESTSDSCPCPDLCKEAGVDSCPSDSQCYHLTCSMVSCRCENKLYYDAFSKKCVDACINFGDNICGLGSNRKCQLSASTDVGYTCTCRDGFQPANDTCVDVDECQSGEPCGANEECHNTEGSFSCRCKKGYMRDEDGACINVDECLNPTLHTCEHLCEDETPGFACRCHDGYTMDAEGTCQLDDPETSCACADPDKSICYQPIGGEAICHPRPGFRLVDGVYEDIKECDHDSALWCGVNAVCIEGAGFSSCQCRDGFAYDSVNYGECVEVKCSPGTILSGSSCLDPCSLVKCPHPLRCQLTDEGLGECHCGTQCQEVLDPQGQISNVYAGSMVVVVEDSEGGGGGGEGIISSQVTKVLSAYFGKDNVEVLDVRPQARRRPRGATAPTNILVEFVILTDKSNMAKEMSEVIKGQCEDAVGAPEGTCVLPGGVVIEEDSIDVEIRNPCKDDPCPGNLLQCLASTDVSGRFTCECNDGYTKTEVKGTYGFCQDINECNATTRKCKEEEECINTLGSFECRKRPRDIVNEHASKDLTIAFGVLFAVTLLIAIGLGYLLLKRTHRVREMVPMTETSGFENHAFHK